MNEEKTVAAKWRENGESDPFGEQYNCERHELAMGNFTDDELANEVYMNGDMGFGSIMYLTAAKERIRWLSRQNENKAERLLLLENPSKDSWVSDNWVPARDQLPKHDENDKHTSVLVDVFGDGERWPDCYYCFLEEEWIWNDTGEPVSINVTYWKAITTPNVEQ